MARRAKITAVVSVLSALLMAGSTVVAAGPASADTLDYSCHLSQSGDWWWSTCTYSDYDIVHWVHLQCEDPTGISTYYDDGALHPAGYSTTYSSGVGCPWGSWEYEVNYSLALA
jgi:hypothetical protein